MKFTKMHGIGNDFVVVNGFKYMILLLYFGGSLFRTQPIPPEVLLRLLLLSATVIPADLLRKLVWRK